MLDHAMWAEGMRRAHGVRELPERERRHWEVLLSKMPPGAKYTALAASVVADGEGRLRMSHDDLARLTGLARTTLHDHVQKAVEVGYVERVEVRRGRGQVGSYRVVIPERTLAELLDGVPVQAAGKVREGAVPNFSDKKFPNFLSEDENPSKINSLGASKKVREGAVPNFSAKKFGNFSGEVENASKINALSAEKKVREGAVPNFSGEKVPNFCFTENEARTFSSGPSDEKKSKQNNDLDFRETSQDDAIRTFSRARTHSPITNLSTSGEGGSISLNPSINNYPNPSLSKGNIYTPRAREGGGGEGALQGASVASVPPDPGREALARLGLTLEDYRRGLEAAAGGSLDHTSPAVAVLTEPLGWLAAGADPDFDVYPVLRRSSRTAKQVRSWTYFRNAVHEALRQRREAAAAPADRAARRRALGLPDPDEVLAQALAILSAPAGGAA